MPYFMSILTHVLLYFMTQVRPFWQAKIENCTPKSWGDLWQNLKNLITFKKLETIQKCYLKGYAWSASFNSDVSTTRLYSSFEKVWIIMVKCWNHPFERGFPQPICRPIVQKGQSYWAHYFFWSNSGGIVNNTVVRVHVSSAISLFLLPKQIRSRLITMKLSTKLKVRSCSLIMK